MTTPPRAFLSRRTVVAGMIAGWADLALAQTAKPQPKAIPAPRTIAVEARPLDSFSAAERDSRRVGALQFRGGLVLTSRDRDFGGLSAIRMLQGGENFLGLTDRGNWLTGRMVLRNGTPSALADVVLAPMLNSDGRPLTHSRRWYDSEALALDEQGIAYVAFERVHQIVRFDFGVAGIRARGQPIDMPPEARTLPANKGIEGLVIAPHESELAGALIGFSETNVSGGQHAGFIIGGPQPGVFRLKHTNNYDVTDAALTPGGDLLILERKWSLLSGVAARIRRVPFAAIAPEALVDGPTIFEADMGYEIDNFEGIAVHEDAAGHVIVTLVSDDNFSMIQRTLFLQFTLVE